MPYARELVDLKHRKNVVLGSARLTHRVPFFKDDLTRQRPRRPARMQHRGPTASGPVAAAFKFPRGPQNRGAVSSKEHAGTGQTVAVAVLISSVQFPVHCE